MSELRSKNGRKGGFTLIELLIVVVIIGILAAIAIPKFSATRERAYWSTMQADLRNLATQQEVYYADPGGGNYSYSADPVGEAGWVTSSGVVVDAVTGDATSYTATVSHNALDAADTCTIDTGEITCTGP